MASIQSIPRFLLPRGAQILRPQGLPLRPLTIAIRHASAKPERPQSLAEQIRNRKPVLPQPDKYRPPSHGRSTPRSITDMRSYGPKTSEEDRERMRTKKYPNMMSPKGTFSHWFINNTVIHVWITLGILLTLAGAAWWMDFMSKTLYGELVPTKKEWFRHPYASLNRFIEVYRMHMLQQTEVAQQKRLKKAEDIEKRKQYRQERISEAEEKGEEYQEDPRYYVGEDGVRRRRVKKWLGIWE